MADERIAIKDDDVTMVSNVVPEKELRMAQLRALKLFANTVGRTYGPMGGYTAYSFRDPNKNTKAVTCYYTKDGLTALKHIDIDKPIEDILREDIRTICTQVVKSIGDGTTSAVLLSYYIFEGLLELQKTYRKRDIIKVFKGMVNVATDTIKAESRECTLDDIYNIALTSLNGNEEMAKTIQDVYKEAGMGAFIDVSASNDKDTKVKVYNGMTYDQGFIDPCFINNEKEKTCDMLNPHIYVFESPIDTPDMHKVFGLIIDREYNTPARKFISYQNKGKAPTKDCFPTPTIIICPSISRDMNSSIDQLIEEMNKQNPSNRGYLCVVTNIDNTEQYLMDISKMTGATLIKKYIDPNIYEEDKKKGLVPTEFTICNFAGTADRVTVDAISTRIINPKNMYDKDGNYTQFYNNYVGSLENTLEKYEETRKELVQIGILKRRIAVLKTNMVDLYVGGIGTSDRMALTDSVEDAVLNCRSAAKDGVCYGANYMGLKVFNGYSKLYNEQLKEYKDKKEKIMSELNPDERLLWLKSNKDQDIKDGIKHTELLVKVADLFLTSYFNMAVQLYKPYTENEQEAAGIAILSLSNKEEDKRCPFNIITEKFDKTVLTSAKTEPAILDSISRIITLLFDTNQFLVPDARFNIYMMDKEEPDNISHIDITEDNKEEETTKEKEKKTEEFDLSDQLK